MHPALWIIGGVASIWSIGGATGTYRGAQEVGEGLGDGLRYGVPLALGATALYLILQNQRG